VQALSLPVIGLSALLSHSLLNPLHLRASFWIAITIIWLGFYPLNTYCYVNAYRHGEFSDILPLQSLGPVFAMLTGWLAFAQRPSVAAALAIGIIVVSVYVLNMKGRRLHNPLHMFTADKPNLFMLGSIVLATLAAMLDTIAIRASDPLFYSFVSTLGAAPVLYASGRFTGVKEGRAIRQKLPGLTTAGILFGFSYSTYLLALASGPLAYVSAVRGSSIFMGAAIGIFWLKERVTRQKLFAFGTIALGLLLLSLTNS
jgi:uncharacterized membrane protein